MSDKDRKERYDRKDISDKERYRKERERIQKLINEECELIIEATGCSLGEARVALEEYCGDPIEAIKHLG